MHKIKVAQFDEVVKQFVNNHVLTSIQNIWVGFLISGCLNISDAIFVRAHNMMGLVGIEEDGEVDIDMVEKFLEGGFKLHKKLPLNDGEGFEPPDGTLLVQLLRKSSTLTESGNNNGQHNESTVV